MLSPLESKHIAEQSLSLQERLKRISQLDIKKAGEPSRASKDRRTKWLELAFRGNHISFQKRLEIAGLNDDDIDFVLTDNLGWLDETPKWLGTLNEILEAIRQFDPELISEDYLFRRPYLTSDNPVPFEEIFVPIIEFARMRLITKVSGELHRFSGSAYADLDRFLLVRLSESCSRILELEFNSYLALTQLERLEYRAIRNNSKSKAYYKQFVSKLLNTGLKQLCCDYPVFARHLVHCIEQWINNTAEQCSRLAEDESDLADVFNIPKNAQVIHVLPGLSDAHDKGRTVALVEFDSGHKIIYKPKDISADMGYFDLVSWLNQRGAPHDFKILKLVHKSHYGWMEFAENISMDCDSQACAFYLRCGALLALFYMLDSVDFHHENIIAMGEYPIPIDCETISQHRAVSIEKPKGGKNLTSGLIERSVLRSHFLPKPTKIRGNYVDVSGMGASGNKEAEINILKHSYINTDAMVYEAINIRRSFDSANAPQIANRALVPADYTEEVVRGFEETYHFISQIKNHMLASDSPFIRLLQQSVRYFKHSTELYGSILSRILHPDFQKSGVDLGIELEVLYSDVFTENGAEPLWPLVDLEIEDLFHHDLPKFMAKADQNTMTTANGLTIDACFDSTPLQDARRKLNSLSECDLEQQKKLIRSSISEDSVLHPDCQLNSSIDRGTEYSGKAFSEMECKNEFEVISEGELRIAMPEIFRRSQVSDEFRMICLKDPRQAVFIVTGKTLPKEAGLKFVDE
ncbi:MAG: hypothetical protein CL402_07165 [Acidiferrobacteraceae bacterium]|nr:hypothetical protein [Acidiferrobacteraceae bacterium]|tara:strand:- start:2327 stop:4570 length:2244 start_codon:yes stop_codon:yes gene_type:complete